MDQAALALAAHREGRIGDAIAHYVAHLGEQPESGPGWLALGILHRTHVHDLATALYCHRRALEVMPGSALAELHLGTLLCQVDQPEAAILHLRNYIDSELAPEATAYADLACAHVRLGRLAEAAGVAARYRAMHPDDHFAHFLSAWVAAKQGRLRGALSHLTDCVALDPMWPVPLALRALLLSMLGERDAAYQALQEMVLLHGALMANSVPAEERQAACRLWRTVRAEAKRRLGLPASQTAHCVVLPAGLGDPFATASLLGRFRETHDSLKLIVFCPPKPDWPMLFPAAADLFVVLPAEQIRQLALCNRLHPDHPYTNFFPYFGPLLSIDEGGQILRCQLGLPQHLRGIAPTIPTEIRARALALFERLGGKPGRSALIAPLSNSNPMTGNGWWQGLVDTLHEAGFVVFQNVANMASADRPEVLSPAVPVDLPIEEVIPFCEAGGHFAGVRSGLCDLLGYAQGRLKAVHVTRRYARNDRYPLSVWLDSRSGFAIRTTYRSACWDDIDVAPDAAFDPALFADWLTPSS